MNLNLELRNFLNPIFNILNALVENDGAYLYLVFVWLALAVIAWILSGGLRKRMKGNAAAVIPIFIMVQSSRQPEPPIVGIEVQQVWNHDDEAKE